MKLLLILGNQLFPLNKVEKFKKDHVVFMSEDHELCSYEKHHKLKILLFLSSMRSYAENLKKNNFKIIYTRIDSTDFRKNYIEKLKRAIASKNIKEVTSFEIEDKFFENKIKNFLNKSKIKWNIITSPMFLNSREDFKNYLSKTKRPFMANFYKERRQKFNILLKKDGSPEGGKWSFDEDNRKKIPENLITPLQPSFKDDIIIKDVKKLVNELFPQHPGNTNNFWLGTSRDEALKALNFFIKEKIENFGHYEDAVKKKSPFLFHSILSPYINLGLITSKEVVTKILSSNKKKNIPINSLEGFIRQVIGWREFMRGIYQNFSEQLKKTNYFNHKRKLTEDWYNGTTGIDPIDDAIKDAVKYGYTHHIIRLMHLSNVMTLSQLHPNEIYKWFMEMFVDSSDWVMSPNVYGMGTFSDGGIFSTKPYICGSNYIIKMSNYKKGKWSDIVDGLYWNFIHNNQELLSRNPRMGMVMMSYKKLKKDRKDYLLNIANEFIAKKTK